MKTLLTQEYLRSGKTLHNLFQRFDIQFNICENLGVVVFNYRVLSPLDNPLVRETRGLILELDTWNVVSKPIDAFFEPNNPYGKDILNNFKWHEAYALSKYDGAMVSLYFYKNEWHVGTRFVADGSWPVYTPNSNNNKITWRELFEQTLNDMGTSFDAFTKSLDKNTTYIFELCTPENRVVCIYKERHLWLVAAVNNESLEEIDIFSMKPFKNEFNGFLPQKFPVNSISDCEELLNQYYDPLEYEGFVVVDSSFNRLKIRNPRYTEIMRTHDMSDEINALRELRSVFLMSSTIDTGTSTGSGGNDPDTAPLGGESTGEARIQQSSQSVLRSVINRILYVAKWVSESYDQIRDLSPEERQGHPVMSVWPEAIALLDQGYAMSDILNKTTEEDQVNALKRFDEEVKDN